MKRCLFIVLWSICFLAMAPAVSEAGVWYVDGDVQYSGTGMSWSEAFKTIQDAIYNPSVASGDEIWVAAGIYFLEKTYIHGNYILVDRVVGIYGGFNGTETERDQRDWINNVTTVDGNEKFPCFYLTKDATIDGFTITNGYSVDNGGGMRILQSAPTITNCAFNWNSAAGNGGAIFNFWSAWPPYSSPTITNCTFYGNSAGKNGGAIANDNNSFPTITNCTFYGNSADSDGGGGGAIWRQPDVSAIITNCILWGDTADNGPEIYPDIDTDGGVYTVSYCDIDQDGYAGSDGNIQEDPRLADPDNRDFHLQLDSPCIDVGINDPPEIEIPETDFEGDPRIIDGNDDGTETVDIGADEFTGVEVETADIRICPKILKLKSRRKAILGLIRLPEAYDVRDMEEDSLELSIPSCPDRETINVACGFPWHRRYFAFFARKDLIQQIEDMDLELPTKLELKLSGNLKGGTRFEGLDTIWVTPKCWRKWIKRR